MKKIILLGLVSLILGLTFSFTGVCEAVMVTGWATADDLFWVWDYSGAGTWGSSAWYPASGWDNWTTAHKIYGDVNLGETHSLYFAVKNVGTPSSGNPAGFLAELSTASGYFKETGSNQLLTNTTNWQIKVVSGDSFPSAIDPTSLTGWGSPAWYAKNTQGVGSINPTYQSLVDPDSNNKSIWYQVKGGKVYNIDNEAQWIWSANNFSSGMDNYIIFRTDFTVVPEPASISLLGMSLLGLVGFRKRFTR